MQIIFFPSLFQKKKMKKAIVIFALVGDLSEKH